MNFLKFGLCVAALMLVTACAHKTPVTAGGEEAFCNFKRHHLNLDHRNSRSNTASGLKSLNAVLTDGFSPRSKDPIAKGDMLFLSGGSLNGAFGAGILAEWGKGNTLPEFAVVTGVSTGAILSLAAFTNTPQAAIEGYDVESESQAIDAFVRRDRNGKVGMLSYLTALRRGGLADISPLKETIHEIATKHGIYHAIANGAEGDRKLYIGVVDVDTGQALALDMTDMATKIYDANPDFIFDKDDSIAQLKKKSPRVGHYVDCFTSAVAASSSVPLAARPIAIDNRLYIDGGARFLVFGDIIGPVINPDVNFNPLNGQGFKSNTPINVYMIINGDQKITPKCAKKDCPEKLEDSYDYWNIQGAREDWNVLGLVERSVDVLQTQVGEFSEAEIRIGAFQQFLKQDNANPYAILSSASSSRFLPVARLTGNSKKRFNASLKNSFENYNLHVVKIEDKDLDHDYEGETCEEWRKIDERTDRNLQFHVNYMRCMIEAGREVVNQGRWP